MCGVTERATNAALFEEIGKVGTDTWPLTAILALAGREEEATLALARIQQQAPVFIDVLRHLETTSLVDQSGAWERVLRKL